MSSLLLFNNKAQNKLQITFSLTLWHQNKFNSITCIMKLWKKLKRPNQVHLLPRVIARTFRQLILTARWPLSIWMTPCTPLQLQRSITPTRVLAGVGTIMMVIVVIRVVPHRPIKLVHPTAIKLLSNMELDYLVKEIIIKENNIKVIKVNITTMTILRKGIPNIIHRLRKSQII